MTWFTLRPGQSEVSELPKDHAPAAPAASKPGPAPRPPPSSATGAHTRYNRALEWLEAGDWAGFGGELGALGAALEV